MHDRPYWMCFVHLEMLEPPTISSDPAGCGGIMVGSQVRLLRAHVSRHRFPSLSAPRGTTGVVSSLTGSEAIVEFPQQTLWKGSISELELISNPTTYGTAGAGALSANGATGGGVFDIIDDWSRCIRWNIASMLWKFAID